MGAKVIIMKYPTINKKTNEFWSEEDFRDLEKVISIRDIFIIAERVIGKMEGDLGQVCGPITSGGKGNIEDNLELLNTKINDLLEQGVSIFDQMPFEETFHRVVRENVEKEKYTNILDDFYLPLFLLGRIKTLYFIPGWESSRGANWEYQKAKEMGMEIVLL